MTILNQSPASLDSFFVPDRQLYFNKSVTALLGHVFFKNQTKYGFHFDDQYAKYSNEKQLNPAKQDLDYSNAKQWVNNPNDIALQDLPGGAYIATDEPANTLMYASSKGASKYYLKPIIDAWSRQNFNNCKPNIFILGKNLPIECFNDQLSQKLSARGYLTNYAKNSSVTSQLIDLLPMAYVDYYEDKINQAYSNVDKLVKALFSNQDPIYESLLQNIVTLGILLFFKKLKNEHQIDFNKVTLANAFVFIKQLFTVKLASEDWLELVQRFNLTDSSLALSQLLTSILQANRQITNISLMQSLIMLETSVSDTIQNSPIRTLAHSIAMMVHVNSTLSFDKLNQLILKNIEQFESENKYFDGYIYPDLISNNIGTSVVDINVGHEYANQTIIIKQSHNSSHGSKEWLQSKQVKVDQNGWIRISEQLDNGLFIFTNDETLILIDAEDKTILSTLNINDLIKNGKMIKHSSCLSLALLLPVNDQSMPLISNYNRTVLELLYSNIETMAFTNYKSHFSAHESKYILEFNNEQHLTTKTVNFLTNLMSSGLGFNQQVINIFDNQSQLEKLDMNFIKNHCLPSNTISNIFTKNSTFKITVPDYPWGNFEVRYEIGSDEEIVYTKHNCMPVFVDHDRELIDQNQKEQTKHNQLSADLSTLIHDKTNLSRLDKLEIALLKQVKD